MIEDNNFLEPEEPKIIKKKGRKIKEEYKGLHYLEKAIINGYDVDSSKKDAIVFYNQNTKKEYNANIAQWDKTKEAGRNCITVFDSSMPNPVFTSDFVFVVG